jgi:hypothetical protein
MSQIFLCVMPHGNKERRDEREEEETLGGEERKY